MVTMSVPSRDAAWALLNEYTRSDGLLKHAMGVEAAVRGYRSEERRVGKECRL